jgi:hypothetical protein
MKKVHVFTSAAFNYIPKVRLLFESLRRLHPEFVLHLALADRLRPEQDLSGEPFDDVMAVEDLGIPNATRWIFCHRIVELATAIKPFMLAKLLERGDCEKVLYMDPDTVAFSRLDDVLAALDQSSIVLTPHLTMPELELDAVMDNEISCLKHGVYNLGFVGVKADQEGREFSRWWGERVYRFCRWIDLVPAFFAGTGILRTPRLNVATWNVRRRKLEGSMRDGIRVNGEPLGFYHFTGFDSGAHKAMADKHGGGNATLAELVAWYLETTGKLAHDPLAKVPWAYGSFSDHSPISAAQRIVYRDRPDLQVAFPDPFLATGFRAWWADQGRLEYPDLASADPRAAVERLTVHLSPGLSPVASDSPSGIGGGSPAERPPLLSRARRVWRREGWRGVLRRLV